MSTLNLPKRLGNFAAGVMLGAALLAAPPLLSSSLNGAGVSAVAGLAMAAPAPSVDQVEAAIARGDMDGAHRLLQQVIAANPNSARARYLDAQVLEHSHRYADALAAMQSARQIDPSIGFTDKAKFENVERRITAEAGGHRASARTGNNDGAGLSGATNGSTQLSAVPSTPARHGPGIGLWIVLLLIVLAVVFAIRWAMRKRESEETAGAEDVHRDALKQATALQQTLRAIKLDLKLSTSPEKDAWLRDADAAESELRALIDELTNASDGAQRYSRPEASPPYRLEDLTRRVERLKTVAEGRPDPFLQTAAAATPAPGQRSAYADEADRLSGGNTPYANQQPQAQQTVIVQQPQQGGFGSGMGGLMTGVLLGEMLNGHHDREVIVERDGPRPDNGANTGGGNQNQDAAFDFGNGGDNWGNGGGNDGGFDMADNSDNNWDDS